MYAVGDVQSDMSPVGDGGGKGICAMYAAGDAQ